MPAGGTLVIVVGPSGVGKDTLLSGAREALANDASIVFRKRDVVRGTGANTPNETDIDPETYAGRKAAGSYILAWRAHGLSYGVAADIQQDLVKGRTVVISASRAVLGEARRRFSSIRILSIRATHEILAARLRARGREDADDMARRLARAELFRVAGADVTTIDNNGAVGDGVAALVAAIRDGQLHSSSSSSRLPARRRGERGSAGPETK